MFASTPRLGSAALARAPRVSPAVVPLCLAALLVAACGGDDDQPDAAPSPDAPLPTGTMSLTWRIDQAGADIDCAAAGAQFVTFDFVVIGEGAGQSDNFNCAAGAATTREVVIGSYDVRIDLVSAGAESLLDQPVRQVGVDVTDGGETSLGEIVFELP